MLTSHWSHFSLMAAMAEMNDNLLRKEKKELGPPHHHLLLWTLNSPGRAKHFRRLPPSCRSGCWRRRGRGPPRWCWAWWRSPSPSGFCCCTAAGRRAAPRWHSADPSASRCPGSGRWEGCSVIRKDGWRQAAGACRTRTPTSLVSPAETMKSKNGSSPAWWPGEFSWTFRWCSQNTRGQNVWWASRIQRSCTQKEAAGYSDTLDNTTMTRHVWWELCTTQWRKRTTDFYLHQDDYSQQSCRQLISLRPLIPPQLQNPASFLPLMMDGGKRGGFFNSSKRCCCWTNDNQILKENSQRCCNPISCAN